MSERYGKHDVRAADTRTVDARPIDARAVAGCQPRALGDGDGDWERCGQERARTRRTAPSAKSIIHTLLGIGRALNVSPAMGS